MHQSRPPELFVFYFITMTKISNHTIEFQPRISNVFRLIFVVFNFFVLNFIVMGRIIIMKYFMYIRSVFRRSDY